MVKSVVCMCNVYKEKNLSSANKQELGIFFGVRELPTSDEVFGYQGESGVDKLHHHTKNGEREERR